MIIINVTLIVINLIVYITVPRLNEKDVETLNKALYYSKMAYEEAIVAKELSLRTENAINEFIKSQSHNDNNEHSNGEVKGYHTKKKHYWYTVSVIFIN
jgi:hypothetical protein